MDKQDRLKKHAVKIYKMANEYLKIVLMGFPEEKLEISIGQSKPPIHWLKHISGTAPFWLSKLNTKFKHNISCTDTISFIDKMEKQYKEFEKLMENEKEIKWVPYWQGSLSISWIMIRTASHAMHHAAMLIVYRHYYGLPPLEQSKEMNWGKIVDLACRINYS